VKLTIPIIILMTKLLPTFLVNPLLFIVIVFLFEAIEIVVFYL